MVIRKKEKETLNNQVEGFFEYAKNLGKITEDKTEKILGVLSQCDEMTDKNGIKDSLSGRISSEEFDKIYGEYQDYQKMNFMEIKKYIKEIKLLPEEAMPFINEIVKILIQENGSVENLKTGNINEEDIESIREFLKGNILALKKVYGNKRISPKLINIIVTGKKENIEAFVEVGIKTTADFLKLEKIISRESVKENILALLKAGIRTADDFVMMEDVICGYGTRTKNIELLSKYGVCKAEDFLSLKNLIENYDTDSMERKIELLNSYGVDVVGNFLNLGDIIYRGKKENIEALGKVGIKMVDDFVKLKDIICDYYTKKENIEALGKVGIRTADDFVKLKNIICDYYTREENIEALGKIGIRMADDFVKLKNIICDYKLREEILEVLGKIGIKTADDLVKLKDIICDYHTREENIEALGKIGIRTADDFVKLKDIIRGYELRVKVLEALEKIGIRTADDLVKLKDIICDYHTREENIEALGKIGIKTADDFVKLKDIICDYSAKVENLNVLGNLGVKTADGFCTLKRFCTSKNIDLIMKKFDQAGILSSKDRVKILKYMSKGNTDSIFLALNKVKRKTGEDFKESFGEDFGELLNIFRELSGEEDKILLLNYKGFSVDDIKKYASSRWIYYIDLESLEFLFENFDINVDDLIYLRDSLNYAKKKNLEVIFNQFEGITIEQLKSLEYVLSDSNERNLEVIFNQFEGITIEQLKSLDHVLSHSDEGNLEIIFNQFKGITIEQLKLLDHVLSDSNGENLEVIFNQFEGITIEQLKSLDHVLSHSDERNLEIIFNQFKGITIEQLKSLDRVLSDSRSKNLKIIFEKYPKIELEKLILLENGNVCILSRRSKILEIIFERYPKLELEELILLESDTHIIGAAFSENLEIIFEKYPKIEIKQLSLLENDNVCILSGRLENLKIIFEKYPKIELEELILLESDTHIIGSAFSENLKIIFEKYPKIELEKLILLGNGIMKILTCYTKNLEIVFKEYPNIAIEELQSLGNILSNSRSKNLEIIFEKYPKLELEELILLENKNTHILSLANLENLKAIFAKYSEINIEQLVLLDSILQVDKIFFMELLNFGTLTPSVKSLNIFDLFNDYTRKHNEIFENIENKNKINDDNRIDITGLYSANEYFEDDRTIGEEIKVMIRELLQRDESKIFIYKKLSELLKKTLDDNEELMDEEVALLAVLNKKGLWNMGQSESLAKFIYQINKLDKNYKFGKAFSEIKGEIKKFINTHKKGTNESFNSFYQISTSLLERSPAIYRNVVKLLNKLDSKEQEIFYKEIFPLYNVELFLGEKPGQYKLLGKKINNGVEGQLKPMYDRIKKLLNNLETGCVNNISINDLLQEEKNNLVENIKQLFKEKFGIKKIPTEFTNENIESIRWHSIYLSNMHNRDEEKSAVLGYFLALKLDGKRTEFRTGKDFDPSEYMDDSKVYVLREYLSKRSERNSISKFQDIEEGDKVILQENESNTIIGNTNGITDRLKTIESNIKTLLDDDIYSERQKIIKKYIDKNLGKLLAKQFQKLSGKNIIIDDGENGILTDLSNELREDLSDIKNVQKLQIECKPISAILNFVNKILNENLPKEIQDFEKLCKPSDEHLELLRKIGVNLENDSIVSSNSYLIYVESGIRKGKNKLKKEEYDSLNEYILGVDKELSDLYGIKDRLTILYEDFKNKIIDKYFNNTEIEQRFESMSPYFFTKANVEEENIVSLMTNDLDIVIKNIRQCLGCKDKGCNNDTDLSFGCDDRFFITTSHREGDTSFADELVTLLPRSPKEEGFAFVMDRIYGNNGSTDILLNNISVIIKKMNKLSPKLRKQLSIFIPNNIGLTLNEEGISELKKKFAGINIVNQEITVTIEEQPITDSYHEFGGIDSRSTGDATISGYLVKVGN